MTGRKAEPEDDKRRPDESDNAFLARIIFGETKECGYSDALGRFCHKPARHQGRHQHGA